MNSETPNAAHSSKTLKKRLNEEQVRLLEASFDSAKKLEPESKFQLARELGVPPRQIAIWYQNKRARWKNQSLELDHSVSQVRLEAALAEKRELEKEVDTLRAQLRRTQDMLLAFRQAQAGGGGVSSCCDEGGGSSLNDDSANWPNVEELYACLMPKAQNCQVQRDYWV